ncbi:retrovirus-related pol polyprotein from transposon TNT 1-94 [Tanacetum coccineum]
MDLCGPMRVASVNGKKYILVVIDDYSRFTWVKCLRSKYEALDFIIKFLKMIQVRLKVPVRRIRTDNGTEFVNQTLREYYEKVGISHETSVARSPHQNGVVERQNHTLIEVGRTMLIYAKAPLFLWAEAVATASECIGFWNTAVPVPRQLNEMTHANNQLGLVPNTPHSTRLYTILREVTFFNNVGIQDSHHSHKLTLKIQSGNIHPPIIPNDNEEENHDIEVAHMGNDPYFGILIPEDHPLENIIGELDRPVSTRLQLHEQALFCYYDVFLTAVEPKTYKDALTQSC